MNVSVAPPQVDIASLRSQFASLAVDMSHSDAKLEDNQREGRYPTRGWDTTFEDYAERLDAARMQFAQVRPDAVEMIHQLGVDERHISQHAGKLDTMQDHQLSFARGWDTLLDRSIQDVQHAADMLDMAPTTPPTAPPVSGRNGDLQRAASLVQQSIERIRTVPLDDTGSAATKDARIAAFNLNMDAQKLLELHFAAADPELVSQLRTADASLEDANWQLAKKPSPDGRFNGVDIPGALRDSQTALDLINLAAQAPNDA